jgi:hypothetical protein
MSRRFAGSLQKGRMMRRLMLRQRQTEIAMSNSPGSTAMLIFLGKNELGQSDHMAISGGGPCKYPITLELWDGILAERERERARKKKMA